MWITFGIPGYHQTKKIIFISQEFHAAFNKKIIILKIMKNRLN